MRWFWIDRFEEFVSGSHAVAVKNVSLSEEALEDYSPGWPYYPASLIVEGLAQTGGLLIAQQSDFISRVVLAKVSRSVFRFQACPGDCLRLKTVVENMQSGGGIARGTVHRGDELLCEADLTFAFLDDRFEGIQLFEPADFCRMLRCLKLFDVGVYPDGSPVRVPQHMLEAERACGINVEVAASER
jgi:3-hydroxyacyl-[acyl-carrier-protein] dehydratase